MPRDNRNFLDEPVKRAAAFLKGLEREGEKTAQTMPPPGMERVPPAEFRRRYLAGRVPPEEVARVREGMATGDDPSGSFAFLRMMEGGGDA